MPPEGQKEDFSDAEPVIELKDEDRVNLENPQPWNITPTPYRWSPKHSAAQEQVYIGQRGVMKHNVGPQVGPFGTLENPVEIMSSYNNRVVGCVGGEGELRHSLRWFNLQKGRLHACSMCNQVFTLTDKPLSSHGKSIPISDPEGLGREEFEIYAAASWPNFERLGKYDPSRPDVIDIYAEREAKRKEAEAKKASAGEQ